MVLREDDVVVSSTDRHYRAVLGSRAGQELRATCGAPRLSVPLPDASRKAPPQIPPLPLRAQLKAADWAVPVALAQAGEACVWLWDGTALTALRRLQQHQRQCHSSSRDPQQVQVPRPQELASE